MEHYKVIHKKDFQKFRVRGVHTSTQLIIAWCMSDDEEVYCVNVIQTSSTMKDLLRFVRECKEKNDDWNKKIMEKEKQRTTYNSSADKRLPQQTGE